MNYPRKDFSACIINKIKIAYMVILLVKGGVME